MHDRLVRITQQTLVYGMGTAGSQLASFLLMPVYMRFLLPSDYGVLEMFRVSQQLVLAVSTLQMATATFRFYWEWRERDGQQALITTAFLLLLATNSIIVLIAVLFWQPLSKLLFPAPGGAMIFALMVCTIVVTQLTTVPMAVFRARNDVGRYVVASGVTLGVSIAISMFTVVWAGMGVTGVALGMLLGSAAGLVMVAPYLARDLRPVARISMARELLAFGFPAMVGFLPTVLIGLSDRFFLQWFSSLSEIGVYSVGLRLGAIVQTIMVTPFVLAWGPFTISTRDQEDAKLIYGRALSYFLLVCLFFTLVISLLSRDVLTMIGPQEYWDAYKVVPIVGLSYVMNGAYYVFAVSVYVTKKTIHIPAVTGASVGINLVLNLMLVPSFGMMGAALAGLLAQATMAFGMYVVGRIIYPVNYEFDRVLKLFVVWGIVYGVGSNISQGSLALDVIVNTGIGLSYLPALWAVGFFKTHELRYIRRLRTVKSMSGTIE